MLRISVTRQLPPRSRRLTPDELHRVFGGGISAECDSKTCSTVQVIAVTATRVPNQKCVFTSYVA